MLSASIDHDRLNSLIITLRQLKLPLKERLKLIEDFLKAVDVIRERDIEQLLCIKCSMKARGYKNHSSIYRSSARHRLHHYKVCCRDFFSRDEIERAPRNKGTRGREAQVKVGMN